MGLAEEYRLKAEAAEAAARNARSEPIRIAFENVARGWRELLAAEERRLVRRWA
jgi:hypothetical protein